MPVYIKRSEKLPNLDSSSSSGAALLLGPWFELKQYKDGQWQSINDPYEYDAEARYQCVSINECPFNCLQEGLELDKWYGIDIVKNGSGLFAKEQRVPQGPLKEIKINSLELHRSASLGRMV